jgi:DNA (cytosine-5)-methyltransferase 1
LENKLKVLDLFSGIGGFSLGLHSTGIFDTIKFVEFDEFCQKVLKKNYPNIPIEGDIKNVKGREFEADIIVGGFPCQPFSVAGKQKGRDDNRYLWPEMFRLIKEIKPEFVIGENVQGLVNLQNGMVLRQVQDDLEGEGFEVQCFLIPASGIGAWHQRFRVWIVAHSKHNGYLAAESRCNEKKNRDEKKNGEDINTSRKFIGTSTNREANKGHERSDGYGNDEDVSNTESIGTGGCRDIDQEEGREGSISTQSDGTHANVSYTIGQLSNGCSSTTRDSEAEQIRLECNEGWHWNQVRSEVERCSEQSKSTNRTWWQIESDLCGVPNGISRELDKDRASRIKSLGNAIVPQMARIFGLAIKKVLSDSDCNGQG